MTISAEEHIARARARREAKREIHQLLRDLPVRDQVHLLMDLLMDLTHHEEAMVTMRELHAAFERRVAEEAAEGRDPGVRGGPHKGDLGVRGAK